MQLYFNPTRQKYRRRPQMLVNGRQPQFYGKWKTTSFFLENGRQPQSFGKMEDNLNFFKWKPPQYYCEWTSKCFKWKKTSFFSHMEDDINI
jgi:hypothetical protein